MTNQKKLKHITLNFIGTEYSLRTSLTNFKNRVEQDKKEDLKSTLNELLSFIPHRNIAV